ncbi:hypothetical protein A1A1_13712 [Planococcus antarcticus DSM 14505]|uniref:Aminoglycoside phosphotransferase n=1 Tax=Planococcus antarcticus DSM 14505 TaxID=1185653 RepID=A0A1C7DHV1_9BACL|nr:aminoglycoside phosphotransferase family protein [Planococcus antarcticus]ANU11086.1 aminoglycoside phosphotransferase [Planococcus antarcticus DSM 14505]EIM05937.1 hypothetical protein A1A1_13712 [Planococcus antarcticus DSM 14505]
MYISAIMTHLAEEKILPAANWDITALNGGTTSEVYRLDQENSMIYILKINKEKVTQAEAEFLLAYEHVSLLPNLVTVDRTYLYMIYTYIPGSTTTFNTCKKELLQTLVIDFINHYQTISSPEAWGWQNASVSSWGKFLSEEVLVATESLRPYLKKENMTIIPPSFTELTNSHLQQMPYLLHGDCGDHNFIIREEKLVGVIDPTPIFGWPHYDLIYAFFSSPHDVTKEALDFAIDRLIVKVPNNKQFYGEVLIILYQRLAICRKHHPADWQAYLEIWNYWNTIVNSQ